MSPIVVRAEELVRGVASLRTDADGTEVIDLIKPRAVSSAPGETFWGLILLIAFRDRATSVHYHPWRGESALAEIVDDVRVEMVAPEAEGTATILETARSLFLAPRGLLSRLVGRPSTACGSFSLDVAGRSLVWDAIIWSNGERSGVELNRVTPLEPLKSE